MPLAQAYRDRHLRRIWNEVVADNPQAEEAWKRKTAVGIFNSTYNENATDDDLDQAFENVGDAFS